MMLCEKCCLPILTGALYNYVYSIEMCVCVVVIEALDRFMNIDIKQ